MRATLRFTVPFLLTSALAAAPTYADQFGNPTVVGQPGTVEVSIGGGQSKNLQLDADRSTGTTTMNNVSNSTPIAASTGTFKEDQVFGRVSYTIGSRVQVSALFGSGKDGTQKSNSYGLSLKFVPGPDAGDVRMGMILRVQRVKQDTHDTFLLPTSQVTSGANTYYLSQPPGGFSGTDSLRYMQYDLFLGASIPPGPAIRPYGGFVLTQIRGTDTSSIAGTAGPLSNICPVGGGGCTTGPVTVAISDKTNISGSKMFSAVLGLDFNPESAMGLTLEARTGTQNQISVAGNLRF